MRWIRVVGRFAWPVVSLAWGGYLLASVSNWFIDRQFQVQGWGWLGAVFFSGILLVWGILTVRVGLSLFVRQVKEMRASRRSHRPER